jgi:hypothetical protein
MISGYATVKKRPAKGRRRTFSRFAALFLFLIPFINHGCSTTPEGPKYLWPAESGPPGYLIIHGAGVFEDERIRVTVRPVVPGDGTINKTLFKELLDENYVILDMTIENRSEEKIIFNPSYTSLMDSQLEYRKPINYTDLFDIVKKKKKERPAEFILTGLRGTYYDLNETVPAGEKTKKLILFHPLSERGKSAVLKIKEVYIGTDTISLAFPFRMREADSQ